MCLNFHPQHPNLLALGCYDGSVNVYDVRKGTKPLYTSTAATGKHTDPVWEIFWQVSLFTHCIVAALGHNNTPTPMHLCLDAGIPVEILQRSEAYRRLSSLIALAAYRMQSKFMQSWPILCCQRAGLLARLRWQHWRLASAVQMVIA